MVSNIDQQRVFQNPESILNQSPDLSVFRDRIISEGEDIYAEQGSLDFSVLSDRLITKIQDYLDRTKNDGSEIREKINFFMSDLKQGGSEDLKNFVDSFNTQKKLDEIDQSEVNAFYDRVKNEYWDIVAVKIGRRPKSSDIADYIREKGDTEELRLLQTLDDETRHKALSEKLWQALRAEKILEHDTKENKELQQFFKSLNNIGLIDDPNKLFTEYQKETGALDNSEKWFKDQLEKKVPELEQAQLDAHQSVLDQLNDPILAGAMKEAFERSDSFAERAKWIEENKDKVSEYNNALQDIAAMKAGVGNNPALKNEIDELDRQYKTESATYKEGFFSPNKYRDALRGLIESADSSRETLFRTIDAKSVSDLPTLPDKDLTYDEFRDELKNAQFYDLPEGLRMDPKVRAKIKAKNQQLYKQWKQQQKQAQNTQKESKEDNAFLDESLVAFGMFAQKHGKQKTRFADQEAFVKAFLKEHPDKKDLFASKKGKAALEKQWKQFESLNQKDHNEKVKGAIKVVASKKIGDIPDMPSKNLEYEGFKDVLKASGFYDIPAEMMQDPKVRKAIRKKNTDLHKTWRKQNEKEAKVIAKEQKEIDQQVDAINQGIVSVRLEDLGVLPAGIKSFADFDRFLIESKAYGLDQDMVDQHSAIRETLWEKNNDLYTEFMAQTKQSEKEQGVSERNQEEQVTLGMQQIEEASFEDLPNIPKGTSTYEQFVKVLIESNFYGLDQSVVDQSRAMREALWDKNNDLFDQWLDANEFGDSLKSIYQKTTKDLPDMGDQIDSYEDFTQQLIDRDFYGLDPDKIMASPEIREGLWEHNNDLYDAWKLEQNTEKVVSTNLEDITPIPDTVESYDDFAQHLIDESTYGLKAEDVQSSLELRTVLWNHNTELFTQWVSSLSPADREGIDDAIPETALSHNIDWNGLDGRLSAEQKDRALSRFEYLMDPTQFGLSNMLRTTEMPMAGFIFEAIAHLPNNRFDEVVSALRNVSVERYNKQNMSEWLRVFTQTIGEDYIEQNMTGALGELREDYQIYFKSNLDNDWADVDEQGDVLEANMLQEHEVAQIDEEGFENVVEDRETVSGENQEDADQEPEDGVSLVEGEAGDILDSEIGDEVPSEDVSENSSEDVPISTEESEDRESDFVEDVLEDDETLDEDTEPTDVESLEEEEESMEEDDEVDSLEAEEFVEGGEDEEEREDEDQPENPEQEPTMELESEGEDELLNNNIDQKEEVLDKEEPEDDLFEEPIPVETIIEEEEEPEDEESNSAEATTDKDTKVIPSSESETSVRADTPKESVSDNDGGGITDEESVDAEASNEEEALMDNQLDEEQNDEDEIDIEEELEEPVITASVIEEEESEEGEEIDVEEDKNEKESEDEDIEEEENDPVLRTDSLIDRQRFDQEQLKDIDETALAYQEQYLQGDYIVLGTVLSQMQNYAQYAFGIQTSASISSEQLRTVEVRGDSVRSIFGSIDSELRKQKELPQDFGVHVDAQRFYVRMNGKVLEYLYEMESAA